MPFPRQKTKEKIQYADHAKNRPYSERQKEVNPSISEFCNFSDILSYMLPIEGQMGLCIQDREEPYI